MRRRSPGKPAQSPAPRCRGSDRPQEGAPAARRAHGQAGSAPAAKPQGKAAGKGGGKNSKELAPSRANGGPSIRVSYDANGEAVCREVACEGLATTGGYCRMHYIKNWKKIKRKELILKEGKLNQYIEELVAKYPDKYIEAIRQDLANDKDFAKVIYDLDLDESVDDFEVEGENARRDHRHDQARLRRRRRLGLLNLAAWRKGLRARFTGLLPKSTDTVAAESPTNALISLNRVL